MKIEIGKKYFICYRNVITPIVICKFIQNGFMAENLITNRQIKVRKSQKISESEDLFKNSIKNSRKIYLYCFKHQNYYPMSIEECDFCYDEKTAPEWVKSLFDNGYIPPKPDFLINSKKK